MSLSKHVPFLRHPILIVGIQLRWMAANGQDAYLPAVTDPPGVPLLPFKNPCRMVNPVRFDLVSAAYFRLSVTLLFSLSGGGLSQVSSLCVSSHETYSSSGKIYIAKRDNWCG